VAVTGLQHLVRGEEAVVTVESARAGLVRHGDWWCVDSPKVRGQRYPLSHVADAKEADAVRRVGPRGLVTRRPVRRACASPIRIGFCSKVPSAATECNKL
jgi:hypothetical protein